MSKLERLLNLTALLLEGTRPLTIDEIGRSIPGYPEDPASFRRSFERDKDDMRELGIPLRLVQLSATDATHIGYTIDPADYYLDDPDLQPDELAALWFAAGAIRLDGGTVDTAFRKLGGVPTSTTDGAAERPGIADVTTAPHLDAVFRGIVERRTLTFDYRGETRHVDPHHLGYERARWYLVGHDHDRNDRRVFRLDRIDSAPKLGDAEAFPTPTDTVSLRIEPWRYGDGPVARALVEVDPEHLPHMLRRVGSDALVEPGAGGPAVVAIPVRDVAAFRHLILGFGPAARVTEPPELVDGIRTWLVEATR